MRARILFLILKVGSRSLAPSLGVVKNCTLTPGKIWTIWGKWGSTAYVKNINVDGRSYCAVDKGDYNHTAAFEICKKLNARLPLPRNKQEADEFLKISPSWTHVDARNPKQTSNKAEWIDAEDKPLGNRPVYPRGQKF